MSAETCRLLGSVRRAILGDAGVLARHATNRAENDTWDARDSDVLRCNDGGNVRFTPDAGFAIDGAATMVEVCGLHLMQGLLVILEALALHTWSYHDDSCARLQRFLDRNPVETREELPVLQVNQHSWSPSGPRFGSAPAAGP